jgi:chorismate mutase/prephenate dehydratase
MNLDELRDKIDNIDDQLIKLLNERMEVVKKVGELKNNTGGAIYRPEREQQIVDRLYKNSKGSLNKNAIEALFLEIFAISRNLERAENIAFLGPEGSFTHQAAESRFGAMSEYVALPSIQTVFNVINSKEAKYGVVPIENSSNGIVNDTIECLNKYNLKIISEVVVDIHHTLSTTCSNLKELKKVYSKDIAFEQCREFLNRNGLDKIDLIPVESTAKAAKLAKEEENSGAICSHIGAKLYNLPIMHENIEDCHDNKTRFLIISDFDNQQSENCKTSIMATLDHKSGALVSFLTDFEKENISLLKIKSYTSKSKSVFFIEFEGHFQDNNVKKVLEKNSSNIKLLGSYVGSGIDI